jgi:alkanesulfonate monooxygenase SsuD/methylene tetrahydromethanopterin reductase-like flavin-dependent oxidoreductase (luciferase family)
MPIEFGLLLPFGSTDNFLSELAHYVPKLVGHIQSLWMTDHFFYGDAPTYEALTVLTYLAATFPQYHVGTLVMGQRYRNPALVAKMGATLQSLSSGRFILGMGAGWKEDEHLAYGYDFPSAGKRIEQLEEAIIIIKRLWYDASPTTYYGRHYRIHDAYCEPKPNPIPPIMIGGSGHKTLRVTAQHANIWNDSAKTPELYHEHLNVLHQHCNYLGRHPEEIRLSWLGRLSLGTEWGNAPLTGTVDAIIKKVADFAALGVDYFIFEMNQLHEPKIVKLLIEELLPAIRSLKS